MKKKIIKIILLLILLLSIFNINTYATINTNYGDFPECVKDSSTVYTKDLNYYIILNDNNDSSYRIFIIPKNMDFYLYKDSENKLVIYNKGTVSRSILYCKYSIDSGYSSISTRSVINENFYSNSNFLLETEKEGTYKDDNLRHLIYSEVDIYNGADGFTNNDIYVSARVGQEQPPIEDEEQEELSTEDLLKYIKNSSDTTNVILLIVFIFIFLIYILRIK